MNHPEVVTTALKLCFWNKSWKFLKYKNQTRQKTSAHAFIYTYEIKQYG